MVYDIWEDEFKRKHYSLRGLKQDNVILLLQEWLIPDSHFGDICLFRYDIIHNKHVEGFMGKNHPLMKAIQEYDDTRRSVASFAK